MKTSEVQFDEVRPMRTSEILRKAADEIRRRGWYQGDYGSDLTDEGVYTCSVCSLGALNAAVSGGDPWCAGVLLDKGERARAVRALEVVVPLPINHGAAPIPSWNDAPERTVDEVLDAFERAAVAAEANGD